MHWFVAAAVIVLLALGPATKRLAPDGALRDNLYNFHEALGALVLIVMVVGLARRIAFGGPAPDAPILHRGGLRAAGSEAREQPRRGRRYHRRRYSKLIQSSHGRTGEYDIVFTLSGVSVAARFKQTVGAWRRNAMYQP
jgi:hypothetical protein